MHGTALGIGERVGNAQIDLLLVNLRAPGLDRRATSRTLAGLLPAGGARPTGVPCPDNYPVVGRDAFRTGTGVHAAAIIKARRKGDDWLADRIYSGVPASLVGRQQEIEVGPMSGAVERRSTGCSERGIEPELSLVDAIFERAKRSIHTLDEIEILTLCREKGAVSSA